MLVKVVKSDDEKQKMESSYEAKLVIGLLHPNVIRLFGVTRVKKHVGIVMEKPAHGSLDQWIGKIDREKLPNVALGVVNGLEYVHSKNVIHRDIRPMTIVMSGPKDDMIPKIGDFSTSKIIQAVTVQTETGDDFYNAPEVKMCLRYGFAADVFSLAIMLFELFNGQLFLYAPPDVKRIIFAVKSGRVGKIPSTCQVPGILQGLIERGWDQNPENRPRLFEYRSALEPMIKKVLAQQIREKRVSRSLQAEEMDAANIAVPAHAMSWSPSCETLDSNQLRLTMVENIKSNAASLINDSVLSAMAVVPRHLFVEESKLVNSSQQDVVTAAYTFDKPVPTTVNSNESSPEIIGVQLSMTEIIQGQSVLLVGTKGGNIQAMIAQLVGINGSVDTVTADADALDTCRNRINRYCPLRGIVDWIEVPDVRDTGSIVEELKHRKKLFHTIIFGFAVEQFPRELAEAGVLQEGGNVSILAPVKCGDGGGIRFQLYLRRENEAELRTIDDFESVSEDAC